MGKLLSVSEYAAKTGKDSGNLRKLIAQGRLPAQKIGHQWVIDEDTPLPPDQAGKKRRIPRLARKVQNTVRGITKPGLSSPGFR